MKMVEFETKPIRHSGRQTLGKRASSPRRRSDAAGWQTSRSRYRQKSGSSP